jgi:hypothetical protein
VAAVVALFLERAHDGRVRRYAQWASLRRGRCRARRNRSRFEAVTGSQGALGARSGSGYTSVVVVDRQTAEIRLSLVSRDRGHDAESRSPLRWTRRSPLASSRLCLLAYGIWMRRG